MISSNSVLQKLPPSSFAFVMATGIVAMASNMQGNLPISKVLFVVGNIGYILLVILFLLRLVKFYPIVAAELAAHEKGAGFLTIVAGTCILGTQYVQAKSNFLIGSILFWVGWVLWLVLLFSFLVNVILKEEKPSPEKGIDGSWFLIVVSTQSLSVLSGLLVGHLPFAPEVAIYLSLSFFLLGVMLYLVLVPIIMSRLLFYPVTPEEVVPSYWINMGAAAITCVAGVMLSKVLAGNALYMDLFSFTKGCSLLFWTLATFWIPVILLMELWRYLFKKSALKYTAAFWSLVFPLGMYTVSTGRLAELIPLNILHIIAGAFIYLAWFAWIITFVGMSMYLPQRMKRGTEGTKKE